MPLPSWRKMRKNVLAILLATILIVVLCGCDPNVDPPKVDPPQSDKMVHFKDGPAEDFWARNDGGNGYPFNCSFQQDHAIVQGGVLTLLLDQSNGGFVGAEYRSRQYFSYGMYSVSMKPAKCSGVISSFFTYTNNPWDEIDIEFLGNDTTKVQFNYFTNGVGEHEFVYDLGFDASEDFHEYAFLWLPNSITWYVDGVAVYSATENVPQASAQIMMNLWNVHDDLAGWPGKLDQTHLPAEAQYQWIDFQPQQQ